jgi:hypothetical protein
MCGNSPAAREPASARRRRLAATTVVGLYGLRMDNKLDDARKELDQEFKQIRDGLDTIRVQLELVSAAGPEADIFALLGELEDTVKKLRTGGMVGSGAKGHREAREKYFELKGTPT